MASTLCSKKHGQRAMKILTPLSGEYIVTPSRNNIIYGKIIDKKLI